MLPFQIPPLPASKISIPDFVDSNKTADRFEDEEEYEDEREGMKIMNEKTTKKGISFKPYGYCV